MQDFSNILDKEVEIKEDHGCPKVQVLIEERFCIRSSYLRHKTIIQCAEREEKMFCNWIMWHLML